MGFLSKFFGGPSGQDIREYLKKGAIILDVRSPAEFSSGHIKNSKNMELSSLQTTSPKFNKDQLLITCCASGVRSSMAVKILKSKGFEHTINGGSWKTLELITQE